jgi:hypothetical protein
MKHRSSLLAALLPAVLPLSLAHDVRISMHDQIQIRSTDPVRRTTSADTARLILARRLGRPDSSDVGHVDEQSLRDLDRFGGRQRDLFTDYHDEKPGRLFVVVEDVEDGELGA